MHDEKSNLALRIACVNINAQHNANTHKRAIKINGRKDAEERKQKQYAIRSYIKLCDGNSPPILQIPHSSTCYSHTFLCLTQPVSLSELKLIQRRDDSRQTLDPLARCHTKEMLVKIKRGYTNQREIFLSDSVFDHGRVRLSKTQENVIVAG